MAKSVCCEEDNNNNVDEQKYQSQQNQNDEHSAIKAATAEANSNSTHFLLSKKEASTKPPTTQPLMIPRAAQSLFKVKQLSKESDQLEIESLYFNNVAAADSSDGGRQKRQQPTKLQLVKHELLVNLCTFLYSLMPLASMLTVFLLAYALIFCSNSYRFVAACYLAYVAYTKQRCNSGGSRLELVHKSVFYKYLAAYFSMRLRVPSNFKLNIDSKNYLLNYHPHGISAFGSVCAFATDALQLSELFPRLKARFLVHESSFVMPVMREVFATRGDCSVNSKSIDFLLSGKHGQKTGNLCAIVVGGLAEADLSDAEVLKVVVRERKGFVKKALIHGSDLIPCIAFGENSVFYKVNFKQGSFMKRFEDKWYQIFKFKHPAYYGRAFLNGMLPTVMPFRRQITVALANPIHVDKVDAPSQAAIDELHAKYVNELKQLFKRNADLCSQYDTKLEVM